MPTATYMLQLIFYFRLFLFVHCFWVMVTYANEFETKKQQKLTEIKN